ncbi:MAG: hypothetical protein ACRDRA_07245 [Pseudonocardiaceae bacterium]
MRRPDQHLDGGVGATKLAHKNVGMVREVVEERTGVGSQDPDFGEGQNRQEVGQTMDTCDTEPRAERDAAAGPCSDGARIEDSSCNREFGLAQQMSATR